MYTPKHFEETRVEILHELMRSHPLATLVTLSSNGINANHIPLHFKADGSPFGTLVGHVARNNPIWSDFNNAVEVLAIFQGPNTYITPSWYATKAETGKTVPTWNYAVVHAHGPMRVIDDPAWVRAQVEALTAHHESSLPAPWAVSDAPPDYIDSQLRAIVGIEIPISKLTGKWKVSQNQPAKNQASTIEALEKNQNPVMAALVKRGTSL